MENLYEVVVSLIVVAGRAGEELRKDPPGSGGYQRALLSLEEEVKRLEGLLASATNTYADSNFVIARREASEGLRSLRAYITSGADTLTGTPGRDALEKVAYHAVEAKVAIEHIEPW